MGSYCRIVPEPGDEEKDTDASMLQWMGRQAEKPASGGPIRDVHVDTSSSWGGAGGRSLDAGKLGKGSAIHSVAQRGVSWDDADMGSMEESRPLRAVGAGRAKIESDSGWMSSAVDEDEEGEGENRRENSAALEEGMGTVPALRSALKLERLGSAWSTGTTTQVVAVTVISMAMLGLYLLPPLQYFFLDSENAAEEMSCEGFGPVAVPSIFFTLFILRLGFAGVTFDVFSWILLGSFLSGGSIIYAACYSGAHAPELLLLPSSVTLAYVGAPAAILLLMLPRTTKNRPLFYFILSGVLTSGSFDEADYRQRLEARWNGSAHFRRLLREMTFLWGLATVLELLLKLLLAFLLPFRLGSLIASFEFTIFMFILLSWSFVRTRAILKSERQHIEILEEWKSVAELKHSDSTSDSPSHAGQLPPPALDIEHAKVKYAPMEVLSLIAVAGLLLPLLLAFAIVPLFTKSQVPVIMLSTVPPLAAAVGYFLWRFRALGGSVDALGWTIVAIAGLQSAALALSALTGHTLVILYLEPLLLSAFATVGLATLFPPESLGFKPLLFYMMISFYTTKSYAGKNFPQQMDVRWEVSPRFRKSVRAATLFSGTISLTLLCIPLRHLIYHSPSLSTPSNISKFSDPLLKCIITSALSLFSMTLACHLCLLSELRADKNSNDNHSLAPSRSHHTEPPPEPRITSRTSFTSESSLTQATDSPLHPVHISFTTLPVVPSPAPPDNAFTSPLPLSGGGVAGSRVWNPVGSSPQTDLYPPKSPFTKTTSLTSLRPPPSPGGPELATSAPAMSASAKRQVSFRGGSSPSLLPAEGSSSPSMPKSRSYPTAVGIAPGASLVAAPSPLSQSLSSGQVAGEEGTGGAPWSFAPLLVQRFDAPANAAANPVRDPVQPRLDPVLSGGSFRGEGVGLGRSRGGEGEVDETWASRGSGDSWMDDL